MKAKILLIFLCFALFSCNGQTEISNAPIGIGLLETNTAFPIPFFKNENDNVPVDILVFKRNKNGTIKFITNLNLKPYTIYEGDSHQAGQDNVSRGLVSFPSVLKFRVIDSTQTGFKIVTNENQNETYYIRRNPKGAYYTTERQRFDNNCTNCKGSNYNANWNIFETWERYLTRAEYVNKNNLKIYDKPNGTIIFENKDNTFLPFNVAKVDGDWVQLKKGFGREFNFSTSENYDGWTQWKYGDKILLNIVEHTYE